MTQLDLFEVQQTGKDKQSELNQIIQEVRTDAQEGRKVSYDVGEEIGGAKKHLAKLRQEFEDHHDHNILSALEDQDQASAFAVITKAELFKSFSLEQEKAKGVHPSVAYFKKLIIRRIDKQPQDSRHQRENFFKASKLLIAEMDQLIQEDDLRSFI
ncbi:hypothetical protein ACTWQB_16960, partial [Piscibacillus sp. B03]